MQSCINQQQEAKIRIVDLNGNPRNISTKTPELNMQAMSSQGVKSKNYNQSLESSNNKLNQNIIEENGKDFESMSSRIIKQTLQSEGKNQKTNSNENYAYYNNENKNFPNDNSTKNIQSSEKENVVEYDLSSDEASKTKVQTNQQTKFIFNNQNESKTPKNLVKDKKSFIDNVDNNSRIFIQVGSFSSKRNADNRLRQTKKFYKGKVENFGKDKPIYRVLLGPIENKTKADQILSKIKKSGYEAVIFKP